MSWVEDLGRARVNLAIVVLGAATVIGLIKLTSLLPEKYYFRFSVLVSSQSSPFIVQPPGVTYAKLCDLIRSNQLERRTFSADMECSQQQTSDPSYGTKNADAIYRVAFSIDEEVRTLFERSTAVYAPQPVPDEELQQAIGYASNIGAGVENIEGKYRVQATEAFEGLFRHHFASRFESLPESEEPQADSEERKFGISEAGRQLLRDAHLRVVPEITRPLSSIRLSPMTKSELDELTKWAYSRDAVIGAVASYYAKQVAAAYGAVLQSGFAHAGIDQAGDRCRFLQLPIVCGLCFRAKRCRSLAEGHCGKAIDQGHHMNPREPVLRSAKGQLRVSLDTLLDGDFRTVKLERRQAAKAPRRPVEMANRFGCDDHAGLTIRMASLPTRGIGERHSPNPRSCTKSASLSRRSPMGSELRAGPN